jgi:hypothetical protein
MPNRVDKGKYLVYASPMSNTSPIKYDKNLMIRVDQEFLDALDRVREQEMPPLTRADAIRRLVFQADRKRAKR